MGNRIVIIHYQPIELYPPAMNDLIFFSHSGNNKLTLYTTRSFVNVELFALENLKIKRLGYAGNKNLIFRYLNYFIFYMGTILHMLLTRPKKILYFETLSSFPVYVYKVILGIKCKIFIHYHEYTTQDEYQNSMKMNRWFHKKEKVLYPVAEWISHSNIERMNRFLADIKPVKKLDTTYILPNYPSKSWYSPAKETIRLPLKIVYVGALSMDTMYTQEFASWVLDQQGKVTWDIYSWNVTQEAIQFFQSLNTEYITLHSALNYPDLKYVLPNYDVGIILYKGHIQNYIFNAPNKLFEYHICGLDVWFPDTITGSIGYVTDKTYPQIIAIDFLKLNEFDVLKAIDRKNFQHLQNNYSYEDALLPLTQKLLQKD